MSTVAEFTPLPSTDSQEEESGLLSRALHRSRNLVMSMRGYAELIEKGEAGPRKQEEWARRIVSQLDRLDHLYSRMEELRPVDGAVGQVSLALAVRAARGRLFDRLDRSAAQVPVRMEIEADPLVRADGEALTQALVALLENACEVTDPPDEVVVRLARVDSTEWSLRIVDAGPGLDARWVHRIGEPFFSRKPGHMGLGVFTSRTLLARHGLELILVDRPEGGTVAIIRQRQQPSGGDR